MSLTKPTLNNLRAAGTTTGDVYFPQTKLLLPFDGANAATTTSDLSNRNATITFNGNASISTAQSKFGGSSLYLDGTGDYLTIADTYWNSAISSGDFTIEFWVRLSSTAYQQVFGTRDGNNGWNIVHYGVGNENSQFLFYFRDSAGWQYVNLGQGTRTTPAQNTWHHVAVTRSGSTWKLFLNGTVEDTVTNANSIVDGASNGLGIGSRDPHASDSYVTGYLDNIRITPGIARYTSNFTPPTTAYLTSAGDVNKQIIVNSTADGVAIGTGGINQARIAKAWVNFTGTGTVAIKDSYNISSLTDNGTGYYTVSFSTAMSNSYYTVVGMGHETTDTHDQDATVRIYHDSLSNVMQTGFFKLSTGIGPLDTQASFVHHDAEVVMTQVFGN